jgi:hypothetical protein
VVKPSCTSAPTLVDTIDRAYQFAGGWESYDLYKPRNEALAP